MAQCILKFLSCLQASILLISPLSLQSAFQPILPYQADVNQSSPQDERIFFFGERLGPGFKVARDLLGEDA